MGAWKYEVATGQIVWTDEVYRIHGVGRDFGTNDLEKNLSFYAPEQVPVIRQALQKTVEQGEPFDVEVEFIRANGERIWVRSCGKAVVENGRVASVNGTFMDITERRKAQKLLETWNVSLEKTVAERTAQAEVRTRQLRLLTGRLIQVEEQERQRIADVLQEDLQQILVAMRMKLSGVVKGGGSLDVQERISSVEEMLSQSIQLMRSLIKEIAVPAIKEGDLPTAIGWISQQMHDKFGLKVEVTVGEGLEPVSQNVYVLLYRAMQEMLFNVVQHAHVLQAWVVVEKADRQSLRLTVKDRGTGFSADELSATWKLGKGVGLRGIRERIEGMGGHMDVVSAREEGTTIVLTVPLYDAQGMSPDANVPLTGSEGISDA